MPVSSSIAKNDGVRLTAFVDKEGKRLSKVLVWLRSQKLQVGEL